MSIEKLYLKTYKNNSDIYVGFIIEARIKKKHIDTLP